MKSLCLASALCVGVSFVASQFSRADEPGAENPNENITRVDSMHPDWNVQFVPVPELLRMHCPVLAAGQGFVIDRVGDTKDVPFQLRRGDVLLSVDGTPVFERNGVPAIGRMQVLVMRRGQITPLVHSNRFQLTGPMAKTSPWSLPGRSGATVAASAFAGGNESVSVSQNGDQVTVDMKLPNLHPAPLHYQGTRDQIENEVRNSNLAPAVRRRVLEAIGR